MVVGLAVLQNTPNNNQIASVAPASEPGKVDLGTNIMPGDFRSGTIEGRQRQQPVTPNTPSTTASAQPGLQTQQLPNGGVTVTGGLPGQPINITVSPTITQSTPLPAQPTTTPSAAPTVELFNAGSRLYNLVGPIGRTKLESLEHLPKAQGEYEHRMAFGMIENQLQRQFSQYEGNVRRAADIVGALRNNNPEFSSFADGILRSEDFQAFVKNRHLEGRNQNESLMHYLIQQRELGNTGIPIPNISIGTAGGGIAGPGGAFNPTRDLLFVNTVVNPLMTFHRNIGQQADKLLPRI